MNFPVETIFTSSRTKSFLPSYTTPLFPETTADLIADSYILLQENRKEVDTKNINLSNFFISHLLVFEYLMLITFFTLILNLF